MPRGHARHAYCFEHAWVLPATTPSVCHLPPHRGGPTTTKDRSPSPNLLGVEVFDRPYDKTETDGTRARKKLKARSQLELEATQLGLDQLASLEQAGRAKFLNSLVQ